MPRIAKKTVAVPNPQVEQEEELTLNLSAETVEKIAKANEEIDSISFNSNLDVEETVAEHFVKIKVCKNHNCCIGSVHYQFVVGKQYNVPENVKRILLKAGLLAPL